MIRNKLLYAVLLVVMVLFFILYRGKLSLELLIFTAVFPVFPLIAVIRLKHSVRVALQHSQDHVRRGDPFDWVLQVQNGSIFSSANATADLEYTSSLDGETRKMTVSLPILPRNMQRIRLNFHTVTCGVTTLCVTRLDIYDPLRLFHRKKRFNICDRVVVMPRPLTVFPPDWAPQPKPDADANEYSKIKPGDDPSEIFDLHAYREGDPVSRIHWKLSSKLDTLMIKEYSLPLSDECILLPEYRHTGTVPVSAFRIDRMLSCLTTAADQLAQRGVICRMALYHPESGIGLTDRMTEPGECFAWISGIVQTQPEPQEEKAGFYRALTELLCGARVHDRFMLFVPQMTAELRELLLSVPNPERIIVFAVLTQQEADIMLKPDDAFRLIPAMMELPAVLANPEEDERFEDDLPDEGGDGYE